MSSDHAKVRLKRNTVALFGPVLAYEEVTRMLVVGGGLGCCLDSLALTTTPDGPPSSGIADSSYNSGPRYEFL